MQSCSFTVVLVFCCPPLGHATATAAFSLLSSVATATAAAPVLTSVATATAAAPVLACVDTATAAAPVLGVLPLLPQQS